jgi:hypothetical protein
LAGGIPPAEEEAALAESEGEAEEGAYEWGGADVAAVAVAVAVAVEEGDGEEERECVRRTCSRSQARRKVCSERCERGWPRRLSSLRSRGMRAGKSGPRMPSQ